MAERKVNVFANYKPSSPVRDHTEQVQVIEQGVVDPKTLERIEKAERGELKAKLAAILDRGIVEDRLRVEVPDNMHQEWVRNDPIEIRRLQSLGFMIDDVYAPSRAIHSDGTSSAIVGDVISMICPREIKEVIDEIRLEQIIKQNAKKKIGKTEVNREEIAFFNDVAKDRPDAIKPYSQSSEKKIGVDAGDLAAALANIDSQVQVFDK